MTRDRIRVKLENDEKEVENQVATDHLLISVLGKDRFGTNQMTIIVTHDKRTNTINFKIVAPEEWEGKFNDYMIESMVLQSIMKKRGGR